MQRHADGKTARRGLGVAVVEGWRGGAGKDCIIWPHTLKCRQPWRAGALHMPAAPELSATQAHHSLLTDSSRSPTAGLIGVQICDWRERGVSSAGLSGAVYTSLYVGFLQPDTLGLLLFIAIVPTAVVLIAACFVNHVPFVQAKEAAAPTGKSCQHESSLLVLSARACDTAEGAVPINCAAVPCVDQGISVIWLFVPGRRT